MDRRDWFRQEEECKNTWYDSPGGKRISAIPVLTTSGIEDVYTTQESVNGEKFVANGFYLNTTRSINTFRPRRRVTGLVTMVLHTLDSISCHLIPYQQNYQKGPV